MTGKDLVLFIINHNLLDEEIDGSNMSKSFISLEDAAIKLGVSITSLEDMVKLGIFDHVIFDGKIYLHKNIDLSLI